MPLCPQVTNTPIDALPTTFAITAVTYTPTTANYAAAGMTFLVGDTVTVSDLAPDGYNGTFTITAVVASTSFTVSNTTNAAVTTGTGTAYQAAAGFTLADSIVIYPTDSSDLAVISTSAIGAQTTADGKNTIFTQSTTPTAKAIGDMWINTGNGNQLLTWNGTAWVSVVDTSIAGANAAAVAAQTTANGKNQVFRQGTAPSSGMVAGDLWFNTSADMRLSRYEGGVWVQFGLGSLAVSYIDAGIISVGTLNAARIATASLNASVIISGTITASQIAAGTITATQIAAGSITADRLIAGTLTGFTINNGSGTFSVDAAGNLVATSATITGRITTSNLTATGGTIGGFTISSSSLTNGQTIISSSGSITTSGLIYSFGGFQGSGGFNVDTLGNLQSYTVQTAVGGFISAGGHLLNPGYATTTNAANVYMNSSSGLFALVTSSLRYKVEVLPEPIPLSSILALEPKSWIDRAQYKENGNSSKGLTRILGVIAEEVAQIPTLKDLLVNYDEEGRADSINYDRIAVALIPLLKDLNERVIKLEGK